MTVMTDKEYEDAVLALTSQECGEFSPFAFVNEEGDCIEFFVSAHDYYAQRVDDYLTLYLEEETEDVAGFVVKNVTQILERVATQQENYAFVIKDGEVCIQTLFFAMVSGDVCQKTFVREYHRVAGIAWKNQLDKVQIPSIIEKAHIPKTIPESVGVQSS
jgi:hypothetical protein